MTQIHQLPRGDSQGSDSQDVAHKLLIELLTFVLFLFTIGMLISWADISCRHQFAFPVKWLAHNTLVSLLDTDSV